MCRAYGNRCIRQTHIYTRANISEIILRVCESETQLLKITIGQNVSFKIDAGTQMKRYPGTISWRANIFSQIYPEELQIASRKQLKGYLSKVPVILVCL
jgi:HlyD family secretion protein